MTPQIAQIYKYVLEHNWKIKQSWWQRLKGKITGRYQIYFSGPINEDLVKIGYTSGMFVVRLPAGDCASGIVLMKGRKQTKSRIWWFLSKPIYYRGPIQKFFIRRK